MRVFFSEDSDANLMENRVLYDGKGIGIEDEQNNQSMEIQSEQNHHRERNVELISELDIGEMLKAIQNEAKINKSWNMSVEDFKSKFCDAKSIDKHFTKAELIACIQPVAGKLKSNGITCRNSLPKRDLVSLLSKLLGDGPQIQQPKPKNKKVETLQ